MPLHVKFLQIEPWWQIPQTWSFTRAPPRLGDEAPQGGRGATWL